MDMIRFLSISGLDYVLSYRVSVVNVADAAIPVFSLEDPFQDSNTLREMEIAQHLPSDKITALLAINQSYTVRQVSSLIGASLTDNEYIAATQVAIWLAIQETSQIFTIDESTLENSNVVSAANWMLITAAEYLTRTAANRDVLETIWPMPAISVNSVGARGNVEGQFNFFGPYTIESQNVSLDVRTVSAVRNYAIVDAVGGAVRNTLRINEPFYVRFGRNLISDVNIQFTSDIVTPMLRMFGNHVFLQTRNESVNTNLTISNSNVSGQVQFIKFNPVTETGIEGTVVEIADIAGNVVATATTNSRGEAWSPELRVGDYVLREIRASEGYLLDETRHYLSIRGNGEIVTIVSEGRQNAAIVTFISIDSSTTAPVGGSVFEVVNYYNDVATRIGFRDTGRVANIKLTPGRYYLREVATNAAYEFITERIPFDAVAGEHHEVIIEKNRAFAFTRFTVIDENGNPMPYAVLQIYLSGGILFNELQTDSRGLLAISLPEGEYFVRVRGTPSTPSSAIKSFRVLSTGEDTIVLVEKRNFTASLSGYVRNTQGEGLAGVGVVAVDERGIEYSIATTNFEGFYQLTNLPDRAVIFTKVFRAPFGYSGAAKSNRALIVSQENTKNLVLLSMEEYISTLPEGSEVLSYNFYRPLMTAGAEGHYVGTLSLSHLGEGVPSVSRPPINREQGLPNLAVDLDTEEAYTDDNALIDIGALPVAVLAGIVVASIAILLIVKRKRG